MPRSKLVKLGATVVPVSSGNTTRQIMKDFSIRIDASLSCSYLHSNPFILNSHV